MRVKKSISVFVFSLLIMMYALGGNVLLAQEKKVYIDGIDPHYPPMSYIDEEGNPAGFDVECVKWIAKEMGFEVEVRPTAWDTIIPTLKAKKIDFIASGMSITEERAKHVDFTAPYWQYQDVIVVSEDCTLHPIAVMSLGYKVGVEAGSTQKMWVEDLIKEGLNAELKLYESQPLAISDLLKGRTDAVVIAEHLARDAIRKGKQMKIICSIPADYFGYAVRKGDKELLNLLNEGLDRLKKSPKWNELLVEYNLR